MSDNRAAFRNRPFAQLRSIAIALALTATAAGADDLPHVPGLEPDVIMPVLSPLGTDVDLWASGFHRQGASSSVTSLFVHGSDLVLAGYFQTVSDAVTGPLARFDGTSGHALGGNLKGW